MGRGALRLLTLWWFVGQYLLIRGVVALLVRESRLVWVMGDGVEVDRCLEI